MDAEIKKRWVDAMRSGKYAFKDVIQQPEEPKGKNSK